MKKTILLLLLLTITLQSNTVIRISNSVIKTTNDGLCNSIVTSIAQDKHGFIWIGTEEGLSKYDGLSFNTYKVNSTDSSNLTNNSIVSLLCDKKGQIWVGTYNGCQVYNDELNVFRTIDFKLKDVKNKAIKIEKIFEDSKNNIWLSTSINGVIMIDRNGKKNKHFFYQPRNPLSICSNIITDIAEDSSGNIWFASSDKGISVYNVTTNKIRHYNKENGALPSNQVLRLIKSKNNAIYISILKIGLVKYNPANSKFQVLDNVNSKIPSKIIFSLGLDAQNNILIGTDGDGLLVYNTINQAVYPHPVFVERFFELGRSRVHSLYTDKENNIWIGVPTLGICLIKNSNAGFQTYRNFDGIPFHDCINSIFVDKFKNILMASDGGGLIVFNRNNNFKKQFINIKSNSNSLADNAALDVFVDDELQTWVATYTGGLSVMNHLSGKFINYNTENTNGGLKSNNVRTITQSKDGKIWIGTHSGGISCFDKKTKRFSNYMQSSKRNSLINNWVNKLYLDKKGHLWIGTVYGLSCFIIEKNKFINYNTQTNSKMSNNMIHSIAEDNEGNIWFGTDNGLNYLNPSNGDIKVFTTDNNLISNRIKGLVFTGKNSLWISDNQGISCLNTQNYLVKSYNMQDGLQSDEFNSRSYFLSNDGEVFFGGTKGINIFNPDMIKSRKPTNNIILTNLKQYDQQVLINRKISDRIILPKSLNYLNEINLSYVNKSITIEFSIPEFFAGKKLFVSSYLDGFDTKWQNLPAGSRSVTYTNLAPGNYTLHLKTGKANNELEGEEKKLTIIIHPPFWRTWWAYLIYAVVIAFSSFMIFRALKIKSSKKNKRQIKKLEIKKQKEIYMSKLVFFTNISHEFRTPLTLISSPLDRLIQNENNDEKLQLLTIIRKNSQRLLHLINQILDLRKLDTSQMKVNAKQINVSSIVKDILDTFKDIITEKNIDLTFENKIGNTLVWFDPSMLDKCIYNIISNAVKFTEKGYIAVSTDFETLNDKEYVVIRISDTGIGMSTKVTDKIFERYYQHNESDVQYLGTGIGLNLVKNILKLHNGIVTVKSELNEGSTFNIYLPTGDVNKNDEIQTDATQNNAITNNFVISKNDDKIISEAQNILETEINGTKPLLLIVEDNADMRTLLKVELNANYKIIEAEDGAKALEKVHSKSPDLIITDIMMPKMNGIELCKALKTNIESSHIPIIILSAKSELEDQILGIDLGADAYITKPFNMDLLKTQIRNLLNQRQKLKEKFSNSINWEVESGILTSADERLMERTFDIIKKNMDNPALSVEMISDELKISRAQLHRKMKGIIDQSPIDLIRTIRMNHAATLLTTTDNKISEVAYAVGSNSQSYFSSSFSEFFGKSPSQFKKDGNS
ncbi:hybrid sensor histidine kinase/response regulator transcription factor [Flavobacterium sp. N3904]|uniref:hybrid sensor histidine kinase/response regulator transcription factor n=1 Tax=Flavobacterium sp. N3904 TaxID=2986835 RepID=UPI002224C4A6|nr:hybrid sensor histidine kinase/response regulator transcription factor [Flavobacterium sp. N3904]